MKSRITLIVLAAFLFAVSIISVDASSSASEKQLKVKQQKKPLYSPKTKISLAEIKNKPELDSDHDGVPNGLEIDGYYYDARSGQFKPWPKHGKVNAPGPFFTDPSKKTTDEDPYPDGMEVSGIGMDAAVRRPGDHPLVPAYPDIYVKLGTYKVTPNGTITSTNGTTTQSSWENTTSDEKDTESHWDASLTVGVETDLSLFGGTKANYSLSVSSGGRYGTKNTVTKSESGMSRENWSTAWSTNPAEAAILTLSVKLDNSGTAPAYDITPKITLALKGKSEIKTYDMEHSINALAPGDQSGPFVDDKLTVKEDELKHIQMGIPLKLIIPQMHAKIRSTDPNGEVTAEIDWSLYKSQIEAVSAHIAIDRSDGSPVQEHLVYATQAPGTGTGSGPTIKLHHMLDFILGGEFTYDPDTGKFSIYGTDQWALGISETAMDNVIDQLEDEAKANGKLMKVVVYQDPDQWSITLTKITDKKPHIQWAYYDPKDSKVTAYVTSHLPIKKVLFVDSEGNKTEMSPVDGNEIGTYTYTLESSLKGTERISVVDMNKQRDTRPVEIYKVKMAWPMFRNNRQHTGRSEFKEAQEFSMKWQFKTGGSVYSSPAIGPDGTIYVGSRDNHLYAITPKGEKKWKFETNDDVDSSPAIGDDGTIYVGSKDDCLYAITPKGDEKWKFPTQGDVNSCPAIGSDGTIYVGSFDNYLYAIKPNGDEKWKYPTQGIVISSPAIGDDGTIYVGSRDHYLHAITPDGEEKWKCKAQDEIDTSPAIGSDGTIYVGSNGGLLYAIQPNNAKKWSYNLDSSDTGCSPAIGSDGTIFVGNKYGKLFALYPEDGKVKWASIPGSGGGDAIDSSPAIGSDGTIYVGHRDGFFAITPEEGKVKWNFKTQGPVQSSPAIGKDGTVYVGSNDGYLYAFGKKNKQ